MWVLSKNVCVIVLSVAVLLAGVSCSHGSVAIPSSSSGTGSNSGSTNNSSVSTLSWTAIDIGSAEGSESEASGAITVSGKGKFESSAQTFHFLYVPVTGNFSITVKIDSFVGASSNQGKAGVFFTAELPATGLTGNTLRYAGAARDGIGAYAYHHRLAAGTNVKAAMGAPSAPGTSSYLKLERKENSYEASYSLDGGVTYGPTSSGTFTASLPDTVYVGLEVNSNSTSDSATAVFSDVTILDGSGSEIAVGALSVTGNSGTGTGTDTGTGGSTIPGSGTEVITPSAPPISLTPSVSDVLFTRASDAATVDQAASLGEALAAVTPGQTLFIPAGNYRLDSQIIIATGNDGTPGNLKRLASYGGAVTFDFSEQAYGKTSEVSNPRGLQINGDYWHIYGINFYRSADNGLYVSGNYNVVEACVFYANRDTGCQIGRAASTLSDSADWPSYNLVLNCESYDNFDEAPNGGENADGFAAKLTCGLGNAFVGCIAHNNVDDGWDLYTKSETGPIGAVLIDLCVAFSNGTLTASHPTNPSYANPAGDKNGFKLGGEKIAVPHVVTRCISFNNGKDGFTWNSNQGKIRMFNNIAWGNAQENYKFDGSGTYNTTPVAGTSSAIFYNNLSFGSVGSDRAGNNSSKIIERNVFWNKSSPNNLIPTALSAKGVSSVSAASFEAIALSLPLTRNTDGSFNLGGLAKPVEGSPLVGSGYLYDIETDYGMTLEDGVPSITYNPATAWGTTAPNLGAR